ncbi:MAG TPA: bifunctional phosphopantothenoylcysteine decarboxylase/phosphopantothenate--cysteine ligase CoaBC [candidate division Zixibacteria bacterium]|nr:bifunctional phosphopantothenoylcysteine decarboxylase/phosphopantothenate--cysteine ligase CoaBC [candidate division Zixibacteria bacterium]
MDITIFRDKHIVLGITGSIACYKAVELASKLTQAGARVEVIMTDAATRFIAPLSLRSVTGGEVYSDMWSLDKHIQHVNLAENADILVIAPATAHTMAKIAHGLADNLLTVTVLAAKCPVLIAPAMDGGMYSNPSTQANVKVLGKRGISIIGPAEGRMASGMSGLGRMEEPPVIMGHIRQALAKGGPLEGRKVVVTGGPTREPIDPVRFLSNRSSGKQGFALAQAALDSGADVTLISGPVDLEIPAGARVLRVNTALEMLDAVLEEISEADVLLMVAAVADFRPAESGKQKIKKDQAHEGELNLPLLANPDILELVRDQKGKSGRPLITLGFAAETEDLIQHGQEKLDRKALDFIAINDVGSKDSGFGIDTNRITLIGSDGRQTNLSLQDKSAVAEEIIKVIVEALEIRGG